MSFITNWWNNYWYGSNHIDNFLNNGQLSTKEFTLAGDHLISISQDWKWSPSLNPNYTFTDLDLNKQFLYHEKAICKHRIQSMEKKEIGQQVPIVNQAQIRYYKIYIVYDRKYHSPRFSFTATDCEGKPLSYEEIKQDITKDYHDKTVSFEKFPFIRNVSMATVNPCKIAGVLKIMTDTMRENNKPVECTIALMIFLKINSSVLPLVEFDKTEPIYFS